MKIKEIKQLFPITTMVTQEIIDKSNTKSIYQCIGANTLKSCTPSEFHHHIMWGADCGYMSDSNDVPFRIDSTHDMIEIKEPTEVTLTIKILQ